MNTDEIVALSRLAEELYGSQPRETTFGMWVLSTFCPGMMLKGINMTHMAQARRTSDARTYLVGELRSGYINPYQFLQQLRVMSENKI